ncbi:MAG: hypothetical protein LBV42_06045 [Methanobrevibacter sp.]|jgi:hypothetical protein|nr:hypothetical protein [Methanobrevibacter sp.]
MIKYVKDDKLLKINKKTGALFFGMHSYNINTFKERFIDGFPKSKRSKDDI